MALYLPYHICLHGRYRDNCMFTLPYLYKLISNTCYDELLVFECHQVIYPPLSELGIFTIVFNHLNFVYNYQIKYILCVYLVVVNKVNWTYFFICSVCYMKS